MNATTWTPEPWSHAAVEGGWDGVSGDGQVVCRLGLNNPANAARIVECVNAMAGIDRPEEFMAVARRKVREQWLCCCGAKRDGGHDHDSCGPPIQEFLTSEH